MDDRVKQYKSLSFGSSYVQDTKLRVHALYSEIPIDLYGAVAQATELRGDESILDVGCGTGTFLQYLRAERRHGGSLYGVDFSAEVVAPLVAANQEQNLDINVIISDATALCFPDHSVDIVSMQHMLSYVPDMDKACQEAKRICAAAGRCVFTANSIRNYPHVRKYRNMAAELLGWPQIEINASRFSAEVMQEILARTFPQVEIIVLEGRLKLPVDEFIKWFSSMLDNWHPLPTYQQRCLVLDQLQNNWIKDDISADGFIYEAKWAGVGLCYPQ